MADANTTVSPNIGSEVIFVIGVGPSLYGIEETGTGSWLAAAQNYLPGMVDLAPYFSSRGFQLESVDASNWSGIFGGALTVRAIVQVGFASKADAIDAAMQAIRDAGFEAQGHTDVPLGSILPGYPSNTSLALQDQSPDILTGLAKQFGVSTGTVGIVAAVGIGLVAVVVFIGRK